MIDRISERSGADRGITRRVDAPARKPMTELLQDTATQLQAVMRGEVRVAISKVRDEVSTAARASVLRAGAAVVGLIGVVLFMMAAVAFLELHMARWIAVLIISLLNLVLAAVLAKMPVSPSNK